jgi:pSer/pThr/pTyr-binding forkhead associated (FHA) protein
MISAFTLKVVRGLDVGTEHRFAAPAACVIGRDPDCNLRLVQGLLTETLSRHHCRIEVGPEGAFVRDLSSRNGTFLNGTKIGQRSRGNPVLPNPDAGPPHCLADGDRLRVGEIEFGVELVSKDAPAMACGPYAGSVA